MHAYRTSATVAVGGEGVSDQGGGVYPSMH